MKIKYYLDTEFIEKPGYLKLISIGLVDENDREYYAISSSFDENECNSWVKNNVLNHLESSGRKSELQIREEILNFIGDTTPEFWGYFSDYDWVLFCWLFGAMIDLPKGWPMFCLDLKQVMYLNNIKKGQLPAQPNNAHHALADAKWIKKAHEAFINYV